MALKENVDYYMEKGFLVMTEHYLVSRGHCCKNDCRHCPYGFFTEDTNRNVESQLSPLERQAEMEIAAFVRDEDGKGLIVLVGDGSMMLASKALADFAARYPEDIAVFRARLERPTSDCTTVMGSILSRWLHLNEESPLCGLVQDTILAESVLLYGRNASHTASAVPSVSVRLRPPVPRS